MVAGRAVYRRRMGQSPCLELDRSTQLPLGRAKRQEQKTWSSSFRKRHSTPTPIFSDGSAGTVFEVSQEGNGSLHLYVLQGEGPCPPEMVSGWYRTDREGTDLLFSQPRGRAKDGNATACLAD